MGLADSVPGEVYAVPVAKRLMADHRAIRPFLSRAFANPSQDTAGQATKILSMIEPHAAFEDKVFVSLLPDKWTSHVLGEHPEIVKHLRAAQAGNAQALKYAADLSLGHFDEEEAFVFPKLAGRVA